MVASKSSERLPERKPLAFLSESSKLLGSSLDYEETLSTVARLMVPDFADWCAVDIVSEDGTVERLSVQHSDPERVEWAKRFQARYQGAARRTDQGVEETIRTGKSQLVPFVSDELLASAAIDEEHLAAIREANIRSAMVVPLKAHERVLGVLTFISSEPNRYDEESLKLAEELADRAAVAVEHARLYRAQQKLTDELEARVRRRTAALEEANSDLEAFTSSVSHDLRAPLRSIRSFARILEEDLGEHLTEEVKDSLDRIQVSAERMSQLIEDLLGFARIGRSPLHAEHIDLSELATQILEEFKETGRCDSRTRVEVEPQLRAYGDKKLMRIALENLFDNACKFSSKVDEPLITFGALDEADRTFYVRDNGVGFDPQYAHKLFQAFERLHSTQEYSGTGIGLTTVSRIVQKHKGRIWAESEPGKGATFFFTLDLAPRGEVTADAQS